MLFSGCGKHLKDTNTAKNGLNEQEAACHSLVSIHTHTQTLPP